MDSHSQSDTIFPPSFFDETSYDTDNFNRVFNEEKAKQFLAEKGEKPFWTMEPKLNLSQRKILYQLAEDIVNIFKSSGVKIWADGGTLLGL